MHWFDRSLGSAAYSKTQLQTVIWPVCDIKPDLYSIGRQQDREPPPITTPVIEFLHSKFGEWIISRKSGHWPPYSPDLSCHDFSIWSQIMARMVRYEPRTITQLKTVVEDFSRSMDGASLQKMVRRTRR